MTLKLSAFEKAFSVEYTALILIILSFIIATFARNKLESSTISVKPERPSIGELQIAAAFQPGTARPEPKNLEALLAFMTQHDVGVQLEFGTGPTNTTEVHNNLRLSLARAAALTRYLVSHNIPIEAIRIDVLEGQPELLHARINWVSN